MFISNGIVVNLFLKLGRSKQVLDIKNINSTVEEIITSGSYTIVCCSPSGHFKLYAEWYDQDGKNLKTSGVLFLDVQKFTSLRVVFSQIEYTEKSMTTRKLAKTSLFSDVEIKIEDKVYPCHKMVLADSSPYFLKLFTSKFSESKEWTIVIDECSSQIFDIVIEYIYTNILRFPDVECDEIDDLLINVLLAAKMFQIEALENKCRDILNNTNRIYNIEQRIDKIKGLELPDIMKDYMEYVRDLSVIDKSDKLLSSISDVPIEKIKMIRSLLCTKT